MNVSPFLKFFFVAVLLTFSTKATAAFYTLSGSFQGSATTACDVLSKQVSFSNSGGCTAVGVTVYLQRSVTSSTSDFVTVATQSGTGIGTVTFSSGINLTGWYRFLITANPTGACSSTSDYFISYTSAASYFTISQTPAVNFTIDGNASALPTNIPVYSCDAINLNYTGTGTVDYYRLRIEASSSTGRVIANGWSSNPNNYWIVGAVPSVHNLNTGTAATRFADYPGYYCVTLETKNNQCGTVSTKLAVINVTASAPPSNPVLLINGTFTGNICGSPLSLFNCASSPITLTDESDRAVQYQFELQYNPSGSCGTYTTVYTSEYLTYFPTDLKNMPGTNGTWLQTHNGYFKLIFRTKNRCGVGNVIPQTSYFRLLPEPVASANFTTHALTRPTGTYTTPTGCSVPVSTDISYEHGIPVNCATGGYYAFPMVHTGSASTNEVGKRGTSFSFSEITGGIGSINYTVAILLDLWNGTSWVNMNYLNQPETYYGGLPNIYLNNLLEDDPTNPYFLYFDDTPAEGIYRITTTVTNECTSYPQTHVFKLTNTLK